MPALTCSTARFASRIGNVSTYGRTPCRTQKSNMTRMSDGLPDIPPLTDKQLAQFRLTPKVLVAARIDREVYDWLMQYGKGYSTRINSILRAVMERAR